MIRDVRFPEIDNRIKDGRYEGQLRDTSMEHACESKRHDVEFLSIPVPQPKKYRHLCGSSKHESKVSHPFWVELLACAARVKALVLWRLVLRENLVELCQIGKDYSEVAAELSGLKWTRACDGDKIYCFDKAADEDSIQGMYQEEFSTWILDLGAAEQWPS